MCRVLMHVSVNFIFIWSTEWDLECSSINTLFSAEKLMAVARLGAAERVEISRHSRRRWLTELQAAVYQLQLQLSGRRKRRVTLTAAGFLTTLSEQVQGSSTQQPHFSQGGLGNGRGKVLLWNEASCCSSRHLTLKHQKKKKKIKASKMKKTSLVAFFLEYLFISD